MKVSSSINFYGNYADKNRKSMLKAIGETDNETIQLIDEVFDSGKDAAEVLKTYLKDMLRALKDLREKEQEEIERFERRSKNDIDRAFEDIRKINRRDEHKSSTKKGT